MEGSLASCRGFLAIATDGPCGAVVESLSAREGGEIDQLVIRTGGRVAPRVSIVPSVLVKSVDHDRELVLLHISRKQLSQMPERFPLVA